MRTGGLTPGTGRRPTVTSPCSRPPFILFIKGTFHRISPLSFCPSPAAIHFNSALVKPSRPQNRVAGAGPSGASHLIIQFIRKPGPPFPPPGSEAGHGNGWWLMCSLNGLNMEIGPVMDYRYPLACPSPTSFAFMSAV